MDTPLDPYRDWLGIEEKQRPLTLYQLLRLDPAESRTERIEQAAVRQVAAVQKFVSGPNTRLARRTLYELESAKQCLLDPKMRRRYDDSLRTGAVAQPVVDPGELGLLDEPDESLPPLLANAGPASPALDSLSRSSVASLLDDALPVVEEPLFSASNLAALGILPKRPVSARREAGKKIAVIILAVAIPLSTAAGLLWLAIRWFDGPTVATAPGQTNPGATLASGASSASSESAVPRDLSQTPSTPNLAAGPWQGEAATAKVASQPTSPNSFVSTLVHSNSLQTGASGNGIGAMTNANQQNRPSGFSPAPSAASGVAALPKHGSLLGPSTPSAKGVAVEEAPRSLSPLVVDLDKDAVNLPIDDTNVPPTAVAVLEILDLHGFPTEPDMMPGPIVAEGNNPLRLIVRAADPRVEIRLKISGERGNRMLSIRPVLVDGGAEGPAISFTNDRVNTMSAKLPGEFEAARQNFNSVNADCGSIEYEVNRLSNIPLNNPTEAANRDYAVRTALERLRRLTVQRTNLEHAAERLQRRVVQLPAIVALREKIDRVATIRFRVFADVEGHQVELLRKAPVATQ